MKKNLLVLLAVVGLVGAFAATGCGSDNNDNATTTAPATTTATTPPASTNDKSSSKAATKLDIAADESQLKFDTSSLKAKAGKVTIVMDNPSSVPHSVSIEGNGVDEEGTGGASGVGQGEKSTVSATLKPGKYTFYCPVDSHEQAGMKGTLTVQ